MMYYYLANGQSQGPVTELELKRLIADKKIGPFDLIYLDGTDKWQTAKSIAKIGGLFSSTNALIKDPVWVVLKHIKNPEGVVTKQDGPFSISEIKNKLQKGDLSFDDYVWTDGMSDWYRLGHLDDFSLTPKKVVDLSEVTDPSIRLGERPTVPSDGQKPVRVLRLKKVKPIEQKSQKVNENSQVTITASRTAITQSGVTKSGVRAQGKASSRSTNKKSKAKLSLGAAEIALGLLILVGGFASGWIFFSEFGGNYKEPTTVVRVESELQKNEPKKQEASRPSTADDLPATTNEAAKSNLVKASFVKVSVVGSGNFQKIKLAGNGDLPSKIKIEFEAAAGEVLGVPYVYKVKSIQLPSDNLINVSSLNVPVGKYSIRLIEPLKSEPIKVLLGVKSPESYKKQLVAYRKQIVSKHITEKSQLGFLIDELYALKANPQNAKKLLASTTEAKIKNKIHINIWRKIADLAKIVQISDSVTASTAVEIDKLAEEIRKLTVFNRL